jgi:UDP-N-acetylglucosamine--N-acetylmuramyl-(pentapeptide) pyrophosphoryl-undecaprenol N-acetylglucosamine transferase
MKIVFTGGGTGGHIFPIIAISREIRRLHLGEDLKLFYYGPKDNFSSTVLSQEGIKIKIIPGGKIRRYGGLVTRFSNFVDIFFKIPWGIFRAFISLFFLSPDVIFSKGGYGSFPTVIAGWLLRTPIFLHESDISPGLANRILGRFALEVFTSFPRTEYFSPRKMTLIGNPIRRELLEGSKEEAEELLKLTGEKPVILVFGGSQGAQKINETLFSILPEFLSHFEIIHQCGSKNFEEAKQLIRAITNPEIRRYYHLYPFLKESELRQAYQATDIIVSRAGSGSIFEIAALGKPSILVPISGSAQNHQQKNAYAYAANGASFVIEEANLTPRFFLEKLRFLAYSPDALENMSKKALEFSKPRAAQIIASYLLEYLKI